MDGDIYEVVYVAENDSVKVRQREAPCERWCSPELKFPAALSTCQAELSVGTPSCF